MYVATVYILLQSFGVNHHAPKGNIITAHQKHSLVFLNTGAYILGNLWNVDSGEDIMMT